MKKKLAAAVCLASMSISSMAFGASNTQIIYDGEALSNKEDVIIKDGRTLLALRDYFNAIGVAVDWNDASRTASVDYAGSQVLLEPDTSRIFVNSQEQKVDVGPQIIDDKIYVPVRFLSETFDCTVDYKNDNGFNIVTINSKSSAANLVSQDGNLTVISRITSAPTVVADTNNDNYQKWREANTAYFFNGDGNLVELASFGKDVEIRTIDLNTAEVTTQKFSNGNLYNYFSGLTKKGSEVSVAMNEEDATDEVGLGVSDGSTSSVATLETSSGTYYLKNSERSYTEALLDNKGQLISTGVKYEDGYTLDVTKTFGGLEAGDYAISSNGCYGFIVNGQLVLLDKNHSMIKEVELGQDVRDAKITAVDDQFLVTTVEGTNRLYTAVYDDRGYQISMYWNSKTFDDQTSLSILDILPQGNSVKILLRTSWDNYLATFDMSDQSYTQEVVDRVLTQFVPTKDGYVLFGKDADNFYYQKLK